MARSRLLMAAALVAGLVAGTLTAAPAQAATIQVAEALGAQASVRAVESGDGWTHTKYALQDEKYPLVIDVVESLPSSAQRIMYLFPGGGLNFESNFFTPHEKNLAHHLRTRGYTVISISPREDSLPAPVPGQPVDPVVGGWGLAKHKADVRKVIHALDRRLQLPYDVLGHSAGGVLALDYAATYQDRLRHVFVVDTTGPYDPVADAELRARAKHTYAEFDERNRRGEAALDANGPVKVLLKNAADKPDSDSGAPRPGGGTFTNAGLLHFALIFTGRGAAPQNWIYQQGLYGGTYTFGATPPKDRFALTHSRLSTVTSSVHATGSGLVPTALLRDLFAVWSREPAYDLSWSTIRVGVTWVNTELGRGNHPYGADLIRAAGNPDVRFTVVPGYGHADPVYSETAEADFWRLLAD